MTTWSRRWIPQHRNPAWLWRNPSSSWVKHQNVGSFEKRNNTTTTNKNKLRWYPQQPQRFIFTTISQACCQTKRWKHLSVLQSLPSLLRNLLCTEASQALSGTFYGTRWTWLGFAPRLPGTFSGTSWHGSDLLRNLLQNTVEPDLALHQSLGTFAGISLNLTRRLHQCTPELFWAEDPISLRCWEKGTVQRPFRAPWRKPLPAALLTSGQCAARSSRWA